ncbi:hypothetical protein Dsin_014946 [Dipteronia sinensis]|uniref:Endoglucanase n=1 Tax=Dipteronia sinensis TaxID=43782 RepID=A0AAE0AMQ7_9ROSI|nr:hypothetical protein Dsin_014946 [Dipteronia sinensis]
MLAWSILEFGNHMRSELQFATEALKMGHRLLPEGHQFPWKSCCPKVSAEIAAALAASSMVFKNIDNRYSQVLLKRASQGAAWIYKATNTKYYLKYVLENIHYLEYVPQSNDPINEGGSFAEFGWDSKHAGINVLLSRLLMNTQNSNNPFVQYADKYGLFLSRFNNRAIQCGNKVVVTPSRLVQFAKGQVDYLLGSNPIKMSYMVGYGRNFPRKIHHRGSTLPSIDKCRR